MRIGLAIGDMLGPCAWVDLLAQAQAAADAGFATVWSAQSLGWDALTAQAAIGARVPGIALGTAVTPVAQRHPLVLAGQALGVQAVSGGRFTLGIGAGIGVMVQSMFGLPTDRTAQRMREYLTVLLPLLRGEDVDHHGPTLTAVGRVTVPATPPPVLLAALGPMMLRLAGEHCDGAVTWMTGPRTLADHIVPTVTTSARDAGRPAPRILAGLPVCLTTDEAGVRQRIGTDYAMAVHVPEYRAVLDREKVQGPADVALVGDERHIARALDHLADTGVTEFLASPYGTPEEQQRTITYLATLNHRQPDTTQSV